MTAPTEQRRIPLRWRLVGWLVLLYALGTAAYLAAGVLVQLLASIAAAGVFALVAAAALYWLTRTTRL